MHDIELAAADGARVAARLFAPRQQPTAMVLIAAAMGVKQDYCRDFAAWLARQPGVILQWRRWCMNPRCHIGHEGEALRRQFAEATFPIVALSMTDDELMTERGTRVLIDCYENAPRESQRIAPSDADAKRIGHFGFFRAQFEATPWTRVTGLFQRFSTGVPA